MADRALGGKAERGFVQVGYFVEGEGPHLDMAQHLVESCRRHMPGVQVSQLTDGDTPVPEGVNAIRIPGEMPMGVRRVTHYSLLRGDWLLLDTDILVRKDVRSVFDDPGFDVGLVSRVGTYMEDSKYAEKNPYNFGVVFSRCPQFWGFVLPHLKDLSPELQKWGGEQLITCELAHQALSCFSVKILPSTYNFTPAKRGDDVGNVSLLHLKGPRKAWLHDYLETECTM